MPPVQHVGRVQVVALVATVAAGWEKEWTHTAQGNEILASGVDSRSISGIGSDARGGQTLVGQAQCSTPVAQEASRVTRGRRMQPLKESRVDREEVRQCRDLE